MTTSALGGVATRVRARWIRAAAAARVGIDPKISRGERLEQVAERAQVIIRLNARR
jgi:hypothetical protein